MCEKNEISLNDAKQEFTLLMQGLSKTDQERFFAFILKEWRPINPEFQNAPDTDNLSNDEEEIIDDPVFVLNSIVSDIKERVPFNAILPSENIKLPVSGENSDCDPETTVHVDEFLYNDDDVNKLTDSGELKRYFCQDCGSKNTVPLTFISNSMSRDALYHIFNTLLPTLEGKTVLDIGSRLGAVLYGAYVYTDAKRIIGVEMNSDFCNLQRDIITKYKMNDRIEIIHNRIEEVPDLLEESDVIIMNNAFEFFFSESTQIEIWNFLKANVKKGTILVTRPSIETTFKYLPVGFTVSDWVEPFELPEATGQQYLFLQAAMSDDTDRYSNITCYKVV